MRRRMLKNYVRLYHDPTALFPSVELLLWPNGEPEVWVKSRDGQHGMRLVVSRGKAGLSLTVDRFACGAPLTLHGNLEPDATIYPPKGTPGLDFWTLSLTQYDATEQAQAFRRWYEGLGPYPEDPEALRERMMQEPCRYCGLIRGHYNQDGLKCPGEIEG